LTQAICQ